ncbi:MAG: gliding motility-associated C-terminal domain-containing protein, partial [Bacteroidales bacterium]|nr:gliding motility-associated C-terminal domain-containing protein [Bacteroidales bacterium]
EDASLTAIAGTGNDLTIAAPAVSTTFFVRFESECDTTSAASVTVSMYSIPVPTFLEMTEEACINGPLYRYVAGGQAGSSFSWSIINGTIVSDNNDTIFVDWGGEVNAGILELTETSSEGCVSMPVSLSVNIIGPSLDLGKDVGICMGESVTVSPEGEFDSYLWHDGSTGPDFTTDQEGWISVEVTDASGCTANDSLYISIVELPVVDLGPDTTVCSDEGMVLDAGFDGEQYLWSTGEVSQQITVFNAGNQEIWVEVQNASGCVGTDTVLIRACDLSHLIDMPTGITPNDDGVNDVWNIWMLSEFDHAVVDIFDQWGTLVWRSGPGYPEPWDGRNMRGKLVPFDSYHFVIHFNDGTDERYVGYITVMH